jgi:hypothetical protein
MEIQEALRQQLKMSLQIHLCPTDDWLGSDFAALD